jgi:ribonuclease PH
MTAELEPFTEEQMSQLLGLAKKGVGELVALQRAALGGSFAAGNDTSGR